MLSVCLQEKLLDGQLAVVRLSGASASFSLGVRACLPRHGVRVLVGAEAESITAAVCRDCLCPGGPCTGGLGNISQWSWYSKQQCVLRNAFSKTVP